MTPDRWHQIEDLYNEARERGPADRVALLERTDPEIRVLVERMLQLDSGGKFLDQPARDILADATKTVISSGTQLGPYLLEAQTSPTVIRPWTAFSITFALCSSFWLNSITSQLPKG